MKIVYLKIIAISSILFLLSSCYTRDTENVAYYKFDESDRDQLLNGVPNENSVITFVNQNGIAMSFRVKRSLNGKRGEYSIGTFSGVGGHLLYFYDSQLIELEFLDIPDPFPTLELCISKTPENMT